MAGEFSDAGSSRAIDAVTGRATVTSATTYLALLTAAPTDTSTLAAGFTEYGATGYSRQTATWSTPALNGSSIMESSNASNITFGPFTAGTGATVTHCALVTAVSGTSGSVLAYWSLDTSLTPTVNDAISIAIGSLKITCD